MITMMTLMMNRMSQKSMLSIRMNMKMNMEPIWSILKMIGYFLMELLVWIGTVMLHVTTFLLLFFVLRKVKNKPKIKKYYYEETGI